MTLSILKECRSISTRKKTCHLSLKCLKKGFKSEKCKRIIFLDESVTLITNQLYINLNLISSISYEVISRFPWYKIT